MCLASPMNAKSPMSPTPSFALGMMCMEAEGKPSSLNQGNKQEKEESFYLGKTHPKKLKKIATVFKV